MANFIDLDQIEASQLRNIIELAKRLKQESKNNVFHHHLEGKNLAMLFEKSSTRTRISFEAGINQLGGSAIVMNATDTQLGKGEPVSDTAKVFSRLVDLAMLRVNSHDTITEFAANSKVPVINALSDFSHPCQIMASVMAIEERIGKIAGEVLTWFGDANNVLNSYIHGAVQFGYELRIAVPFGYDFCDQEISKAVAQGANVKLYCEEVAQGKKAGLQISGNVRDAVTDCSVLITDTWVSMGQSSESDESRKRQKLAELQPYQVTKELMKLADSSAIFTHCLPAYRGYEVEEQVIDSSYSIVFEEAENRLHVQKAIMIWCMNN
jgi:ornithine carbamoyltransferase